jgi:hypothetical protein
LDFSLLPFSVTIKLTKIQNIPQFPQNNFTPPVTVFDNSDFFLIFESNVTDSVEMFKTRVKFIGLYNGYGYVAGNYLKNSL